MTETRARSWKRILDDAGLRPIGYAVGSGVRRCRSVLGWAFLTWMATPGFESGPGDQLCREFGIRFNYENHPEKSAQEILAVIGGGNEWLGVCVDTGWLARSPYPRPRRSAPSARSCGTRTSRT